MLVRHKVAAGNILCQSRDHQKKSLHGWIALFLALAIHRPAQVPLQSFRNSCATGCLLFQLSTQVVRYAERQRRRWASPRLSSTAGCSFSLHYQVPLFCKTICIVHVLRSIRQSGMVKEFAIGGGNMAKLFNCTPKPAMLRSVQNERWNVSGALAELLDNSFGPGRGNATTVTIFHDLTARTLTVLDNGRGMDAIGRLFQHGNSIGHSIGDIGEYGAGGTKALLWLASRVSIWTLREQMVQHDNVIWKNWFNLDSFDDANVSNDWRRSNSSNTPAELLAIGHGT